MIDSQYGVNMGGSYDTSKTSSSKTEHVSDESKDSNFENNEESSNSFLLSLIGLNDEESDELSEEEIKLLTPLIEKYGMTVVKRFTVKVLTQWRDTSTTLTERILTHAGASYVRGRGSKAIAALEAVNNTSATSSPGAKLMEIHALFNLVQSFLPYVPGFSEFMSAYLVIMEGFALELDRLQAIVSDRQSSQGGVIDVVSIPGAFSGGKPLHDYLFKVIHINEYTPEPVPESIVEWVKQNHDLLALVTDETPPAKTESLWVPILGDVDSFWPDEVDPRALSVWFAKHASGIADLIYGELKLNRFEYEGIKVDSE